MPPRIFEVHNVGPSRPPDLPILTRLDPPCAAFTASLPFVRAPAAAAA